jgi:hypothetical protein
MSLEKQNTNSEEDSAKKLEKETEEKQKLEWMFSSENNEAWWENLDWEEKIDKTKAVNLITEKIQEKSNNINDEQTQAQIDALMQEITVLNRPWKLTPEEKIQLWDIYKEIESLHGTEHAENAKAGEEAKKSNEASQKEYAQKLLDSTEKLRDFLKNSTDEIKKEKIYQETAEQLERLKDELPNLDSDSLIPEASPESKS